MLPFSKVKTQELSMENNTKWYKTNLGIIALLILFFPVGIFLMWRYSTWHKYLKIGITTVFALFILTGAFGGDDNQTQTQESTPVKVAQPSPKADNPTPTVNEPEIVRLSVDIKPTMDGFELKNNETFVIAVCEISINGGVLDSGYVYMMGDYLEGGKSKVIPYGEFSKKGGERFNLVETKPKTMKITCQEANSKKGYALFEAN